MEHYSSTDNTQVDIYSVKTYQHLYQGYFFQYKSKIQVEIFTRENSQLVSYCSCPENNLNLQSKIILTFYNVLTHLLFLCFIHHVHLFYIEQKQSHIRDVHL